MSNAGTQRLAPTCKKRDVGNGWQGERLAGVVAELRAGLVGWYGVNRRDLPWRRTSDPYAIWVSEIMLQQTRVVAVVDRYKAFMGRLPTVESLAAASEEQVLALWSGLGYYRRARMLHKAAKFVVDELHGAIPETAAGLRGLAGIGAYTSAAIASIAHGEAVAVVDGNVERVLCRLAGWDAGRKGERTLRRRVEALAAELVDPKSAGDFNQAMMELGATVCLPRNPQCMVCPWVAHCVTRGEHKTAPRAAMQSRETGHALVLRVKGRRTRQVLLEQRAATQTVMPGMWELPALKDLLFDDDELRMTVRHAIMQVNYSVRIRDVAEGDVEAATVNGGERRWVGLADAGTMALTGLTRKVLTRGKLLG